jgi:hypothetical protein
MPLSEQEQRLLDEMERNLYHNDADDVTTVGGRRGRAGSLAVFLGVAGIIVGLGLLLLGVGLRVPVIGIVGFVLMFAGAVLLIAPPRRLSVARSARADAPHAARSSFMDSLGERWERRNDNDDER